jgi:Spy/CpxP family protein refolding chaperone
VRRACLGATIALMVCSRAAAPQAPALASPAQAILAVKDDLQLTASQVSRLRSLETAQSTALSRAMAAYLRAEADLLDAIRVDSLPLRRTALEKRAKSAIDAEMSRLQAEKDARAVLTQDQRTKLAELPVWTDARRLSIESSAWEALVVPAAAARKNLDVTDSTEVRITVMPTWADIYIDGKRIGSGKKFLFVAIGTHAVLFHATGCKDVTTTIEVLKGPPIVLPTQTLDCKLSQEL